ncbi:3-oxoacyl-[acyl-carrier-protein] synthase III C-terminal domain-containing protein [Amycolatopsis nalaikhensis]|uniref:3-oxoacyl-[acyl-carrier-protein] synthase III C-terminal domain-containing protein n=1 Tax=Amycolatopsis nalaikhensis TaxID=715472 RepID=A0ABY8X8W7_9PSEU|nr:3-oxoacyl-[acyl-carrier-protein] synthase III C-terminal domain-containing protein [Amycolatopsis sp. 2-2]WIV52829.1 3-oxoacyl-[acyl-carrier-protein] synthase III C-terminal domain-containing protein [Amycolatopsis sp. 2-2]
MLTLRWNNLHLRGIGAALGEIVAVEQLGSAGSQLRMTTSQRAVSIARNTTGMDLAVRAGRNALASMAMTTTGPLQAPDLHFHAAIWRGSRGIDFWSRAAYVRTRLGLPAGRGIATELNAMSNSLVGGIDISARVLAGSPDLDTVLLTGGETFGQPAFDHLTADHGIAYGDGGSALILGRLPGLARVIATSSYTDPTLEQLHRGNHRFAPAGTTELGIERIGERKRQYTDLVGAASVTRRNHEGVHAVANEALRDAELDRDQLLWVLLPHYGRHLLDTQCLKPLGITADRTLCHAGDQWGHIGPNDQIIGLTHLLARGAVAPGDHVALLGIGIGMTWTAAILRIDTVPPGLGVLAPPLRWPWRALSDASS